MHFYHTIVNTTQFHRLVNKVSTVRTRDLKSKFSSTGKLWKFPISNEDGLDQAKQEKFYDHVFFDDLIEASPDKQPIREFMNDAALGLSQNAYMTAERKRHYLQWYNDYFNENKDLMF